MHGWEGFRWCAGVGRHGVMGMCGLGLVRVMGWV